MGLRNILEALSRGPTMMDLPEEKGVINELMKLDKEVVDDPNSFSRIMGDLLVSRSASFFDIEERDEPFFIAFAEWLAQLAPLFESPRREELEDYARIYRQFPRAAG